MSFATSPKRSWNKNRPEIDRDDELLAAIRYAPIYESVGREGPWIERPVVMSSEGLMGKLPKADRTLKKGILYKFSSTHQWKPMQVALTTAGLFMARPNEEQLRDP
jgi:hypothetical protein